MDGPQVPPVECRRRGETAAAAAETGGDVGKAIAWALLAVAGELAEIRREMRRSR